MRSDVREEREPLTEEIRRAAPSGDRSRVLEAQVAIERTRHQESVASAIMHALRSIADGIAWKALRYDRMAIVTFGRGRRVGHLAFGTGLNNELAYRDAYWEHGILALHNDLTNVLRHGDLTLVRWPMGPGMSALEAGVEEVKAGWLPDPGSAQMRRIDDALRFMQTGEHPTLAEGARLESLRILRPYRTFQAQLGPVIAAARKRGAAWLQLSPCQAIVALELGTPRSTLERATIVFEGMQRRLPWWIDGRRQPFVWTSGLRRMRDRRDTVVPIAPYSIFDLSPEDAADVILGYVEIVSYLNADVLELILARDGITARTYRATDAEKAFLRARRGGTETTLPAILREQVLVELTTPATLTTSVTAALDQPRPAGVHLMVVFDDETSAWNRRLS